MSVWTNVRVRSRQGRYVIRSNPKLNVAYRSTVGVVGALVLIGGIIAIPYPGPGWAIVFLGLAILASEFHWARRLLAFARSKYDAWLEWMKRQHWSVSVLFGIGTCAVVLVSLWLLGALNTAAGWVGIDWPWLASPLF
ncbi:TIGR02611 family protein [Gordonia sinesedis]